MIKSLLPVAALGAVVLAGTGCKNAGDGGSFKTVNGVHYKIVRDNPGKNAQIGDIVEFNLIAKADTMVLGNTWEQNGGKPVSMPLQTTAQKADFQAVFPFMSAGDSALIEVSCDTMLKYMPPQQGQLPPWLKKGGKVVVNLSLVSVKSQADFENDQKKKKQDQASKDDAALKDYFTKNNITPQRTESGLYYTISREGTGAKIEKGQMVSMKYTGKTLAGETFDSNVDPKFNHTDPFSFPVGMGQVIPGWDEGVQLLKKGSKAMFYIPSVLAYGEGGGPNFGPNSCLVFDVEVLDVKAMPAQGPGAGGPQPIEVK